MNNYVQVVPEKYSIDLKWIIKKIKI